MLTKSFHKNGRTCRVTFSLPKEAGAESGYVCGEFNDWDRRKHPLKRRKDGRLTTSLTLPVGRSYRFRYLLDGGRWENDYAADAYWKNGFGTDDSVVNL